MVSIIEFAAKNHIIIQRMNIQTIILLIIIIAAAGLVLWRIFKQHSHKHGGCSYCDVEGCTLRDLMAKSKKNMK